MRRLFPFLVLILPALQGCGIYSYYPVEKFERKDPSGIVEFRMKDNHTHRIFKRDLLMIKYSPDSYTIYFKTGPVLQLRKEDISTIRMIDNGKVTLEVTLIMAGLIAAFYILLIMALGGK